MQAHLPIFQAWRVAERAARAAERHLLDLMAQPEMRGDPQKVRDQAASARLLRMQAHGLFDDAMRELKDVADALHHRRVLSRNAVVPSDELKRLVDTESIDAPPSPGLQP